MFSKLAIFTVAIFTVFVSAAPTDGSVNQCNVGKMQCCESTTEHDSETGQAITSVLGAAAVGPVTGLIGAHCSPLSGVGIGGNSCNAQPVCCQNNNFNGLIALGCTPISVAGSSAWSRLRAKLSRF